MNEKLLGMLNGNEKLYPKIMEEKYPRVFNRIIELWYTQEIDDYFTELLMDTRGGTRQGFAPEVASEIFSLSMAITKLRAEAEKAEAGNNPWANIEDSKKSAIEQQGYQFSPKGFLKSAESGNRSAVMLFISSGVDIDTKDERGWTPLMISTFSGKEEVAALLIRSGASVHAKDSAGYGPLHWAAFNGFSSVISMLIEKHADVNLQSNHGLTPLLQTVTRGHLQATKLLIAGGAQVNLASNDGWTPLHKAAANGRTEIVALLLAKKANRDAQLANGTTPLDLAVKNKHSEIVAMLNAATSLAGRY